MSIAPSTADALLAQLLEQLTAAPPAEQGALLECLAKQHPECAAELRSLWAMMAVVADIASAPDLDEALEQSPTNAPDAGTFPRRVGDYELLEELGRGGMGVVYRARQLSLGREVALKMILRGALASPEDLSRFRSEAESAARLSHPHLVAIHEVGAFADQPYFSMQYVEGTTLARRIADGPLPGREAAQLLLPVCRAIAAAHRAGVLHRDLKPSNILLDQDGRPLVTDFGLAKRFDTAATASLADHTASHDPSVTRTGAILGTPGYMAPEQAAGQRGSVGVATDVYSLGALLYAMLTGRPPFQAASPVDTVLMVLEQDPPPPRLVNPDIDADLELIVLKTLQKPADLRYASADALADDLEAFLRNEPVAARSSRFSQVLSRAFRPTHHAAVLQNWGLLWMWHALAVFVLCVITNVMQLQSINSRTPYVLLWTAGAGTWAVIFWNLRRRAGPVTFVERQIAHIWASAMGGSSLLFAIEALLGLPVLSLSPVLAILSGGVFIAKAGVLSGEFYLGAILLFATALLMAYADRIDWPYGLTLFGAASAITFAIPGWKFHRQRLSRR